MVVSSGLQVAETAEAYQILRAQWQEQTIALVPTMGALHEGHAALIRQARILADKVVVSIFVNPLQFGPSEDLSRYPRPLDADLALCESLGVDVVFHPTVEVMYPEGMSNVTKVIPPASLTDSLCGAYRPGHFTGVATVVLKLFNVLRPTLAIFGEKDAQQLAVIRKMVKDLHVPVEIVGHPIIREANGLALSSRNRYLSMDAEKQAALALIRILQRVAKQAKQANALDAQAILAQSSQQVVSEMQSEIPEMNHPDFFRIQYLEAVDAGTFVPAKTLKPGVKLLIAAYVKDVRLIDNLDLHKFSSWSN